MRSSVILMGIAATVAVPIAARAQQPCYTAATCAQIRMQAERAQADQAARIQAQQDAYTARQQAVIRAAHAEEQARINARLAELKVLSDAQARELRIEEAAKAQVAAQAATEARRIQEATKKLRADPAFVAVLGADPRDVAVLIVGKDTPNVIRNLNGNPAFQVAPIACLPLGGMAAQPDSLEMRFLATVTASIEQKGGFSANSLLATVCDPADLGNYDLVIFTPTQVANGSLEVLTPLVEAIRSRQFVAFGSFTYAGFENAETAKITEARAVESRHAAERQEARANFQSRDPAIFSAIHFDYPAPVVCLLVSPDVDGLRYLIKRNDSPFGGLLNKASVVREVATPDALFISMKKHDCLAAIAPAGVLKVVMTALTRDNIIADIDGCSLSPDRLANWKIAAEKDLLAGQAQQATDVAEQRRLDAIETSKTNETRLLQAEREKNSEASRQEELERLRKQVVSKANAVVDSFADHMRTHLTSVGDEVIATKQRTATGQVLTVQQLTTLRQQHASDRMDDFQPWASWLETKVQEGWVFSPITPVLEDYGRAEWKGTASERMIEAISVQVKFPAVNRTIGEKATYCVVFSYLNDEEFTFRRSQLAVPCDKYDAAFLIWTQQNKFKSQWKLLN
jgi:hypothetical protein